MTTGDNFFIGELAERAGVSRDTIRYYESVGVLSEPPRTATGYRLYDIYDVERIDFIKQAQVLGLALDEISDILAMVDEGREPCVHVQERIAARLEETRDRIRELRMLEGRLEKALSSAEKMDDPGAAGCRCGIIESAGGEQAAARSA